jgi:hypothetical protein
MDIYRHSELTSPTNIRLLRLLPRKKDPNNIRCELFEYSLPDETKSSHLYEAISYVWGSKEDLQTIIIDNCSFKITRNLFTALRHLRDEQLSRIIWVDAVCINQKEDTEKEHQIALMAEIYAKSSRVVVWLGDTENDSDRAIETIRLMGIMSAEFSTVELPTEKLSQQGIPQLLERPWFQRVWVREPRFRNASGSG